MAIKAVQQIMLGSVCRTEHEAADTLARIYAMGYEGIELNGFMIRKTPPIVRILTRAAGMPVGRGGNFNWTKLIRDSGLAVIAVHEDLGTIEREPESVLREADAFGTDKIVVTGMYRFDMSDQKSVADLAERLNRSGRILSKSGVRLLYHNHNSEFRRLVSPGASDPDADAGTDAGKSASPFAPDEIRDGKADTAYAYLIEHTDPEFVDFEFDSYWPTEAGVNVPSLMRQLGTRMKLWHINDRGTRIGGPSITPILKSDCMELGYGNMDLEMLSGIALENKVDAVVLEMHRNYAEHSPLTSIRLSSGFMNSHFPHPAADTSASD
ncbi:MAG: sugar phosphate isomerase/epimerase [Lachnospiraceae bacterium]|nr:sugar phosphate isomerase/epimerase [Lachnospiraceae bacterium]